MGNLNVASVIVEGRVSRIAPQYSYITALTAPTNQGPTNVWLFTPGEGGSAPSLDTLFAEGQEYIPGAQIQQQDQNAGTDLGSIYGSAVPDSAPDPATTVAVSQEILCDTGDIGGFPSIATFTRGSFVQPAVSSDVTVTVHDATSFGGLSAGAELYCGGCIYNFVSASGSIGGTVTMVNMGLGASRIATTA